MVVHGTGWNDVNDRLWIDALTRFETVVGELRSMRGVRVVELSRPRRRNSCWPNRLYDDWVDRMAGENGCWITSEEEEASREVYKDDPWWM